MLRALLVLIALVIVAAIVLVATGILDLRQTQEARAPQVELKVNKLEVGTTTTNVQLPAVEMKSKQVDVPTVRVDTGEAANAQ